MRVAAFLSQDPALLAVYHEGGDFHYTVALRIFGDPEQAKVMRPYAKTVVFASLYGAGPSMLAIQLNDAAAEQEAHVHAPQRRWDEPAARALYDEFWEQFPAFAAWANEQKRLARVDGVVVSHFGRRRRWPLITRATLHDIEKEAVNFPVQSTASDILLLGMIETHAWLQREPIARIVLTVHDSLLLEALDGREVEVGLRVKAILEAIPAKYQIDVPFAADVKVGDRWASLVEIAKWQTKTDRVAA